jgi:SNF2 family DNA or RNA helicase
MQRRPFTPRNYQRKAMSHLIDVPRCALFAGMGTGKTVSTLTVIDSLIMAGYSRPAIIFAPLRVAQSTWPDELAKWEHLSGLTISPVVGTPKERAAALRRDAAIYTTNYENIPWLFDHLAEQRRAWPFGIVVPDEATRLKSARPSIRVSKNGKEYVQAAGAKRVRELARIAHTPGLIDRIIELTGTPAPNGLADLWGQLWFLDGGQRLGRTFEGFTQRWFRPKRDGYGVVPLAHAEREIHERIADICLTVDFDGELPPAINNTIYVDLPAKARKLYRDMEKEMFMELAGHEVEAFNAAARTMKCLQVANGAAYVDDEHHWAEVHDVKLQALESIVEEAAGMPVIVAYQFRSDLARLLKAFPKGRHLDRDPETLRAFRRGEFPLLFAHPASAGHGVDGLQDATNIMAFFGHDWNLETYQQMRERIGPVRQAQSGLNRPVFYHHIVARGTVDELVMERRESKREVQDILLDAMRRH